MVKITYDLNMIYFQMSSFTYMPSTVAWFIKSLSNVIGRIVLEPVNQCI